MHIDKDTILTQITTHAQEDQMITVSEDTVFQYLLILRDQAELNLTVRCLWERSKAVVKILCIGSANCHIKNTTLVSLDANHAQCDVYMLSLLKNESDVQIHGNVTLSPNVSKVSGHLLEENIILGEKIKIRTAPILDVRSSDVSASHGCRVERIDPKRLFYMQSRGLTPWESQSLILDGYLNVLFEWFDVQDEFIQDIKQEIVS